MNARYLISGTQLGLLQTLNEQEREKLLQDIRDYQYLGDSYRVLSEDVTRSFGFARQLQHTEAGKKTIGEVVRRARANLEKREKDE